MNNWRRWWRRKMLWMFLRNWQIWEKERLMRECGWKLISIGGKTRKSSTMKMKNTCIGNCYEKMIWIFNEWVLFFSDKLNFILKIISPFSIRISFIRSFLKISCSDVVSLLLLNECNIEKDWLSKRTLNSLIKESLVV